jgi:hypothetical protein
VPELPRIGGEGEPLAQQRVVADLRMSVEGKVVAGERYLRSEQGTQPGCHQRVQRPLLRVPEEPVMAEDQLGAGRDRALDRLQVGRDRGGEHRHLGPARHLEAVRAVILERVGLEQPVAKADDLVASRHPARLFGPESRDRARNYHAAMAAEPDTGDFIQSLMETDLYSIGAFFCDQHPELVDEVVERSEAIQEAGLERWAAEADVPIEEGFRTLLTGLAVRYYKAVAG